jgi:DNA protecting protein DprA
MSTETGETTTAEVDTHSQELWLRETISLLALSTVPGIGYWTLRNLSQFGYSFYEVLKRPSSFDEFGVYLSRASCKVPKKILEDWSEVQQALWTQGKDLHRRLKRDGVQVIHIGESRFPKSLRRIPQPPRWLFVQGDLSILHQPSIAVVGTRQPSNDGVFLAKYVGACIPSINAVTVSGLANGIDQIIHCSSIRFQTPTIAVLGTGVFKNYPAGSESLRNDICINGGAVVTEYLPDQTYSAENFVRRNRLQTGLANVLIPVEWKSQSGTAHTVRYANESRKNIACLRMSDWREEHHPELALARELEAEVFTIPQQGNQFLDFVRSHVFETSIHLSNDLEKQVSVNAQVCKTKSEQMANHSSEQTSDNKKNARQLNLFE